MEKKIVMFLVCIFAAVGQAMGEGVLLGPSPTIDEIYDPETGQVLLMQGLPLDPAKGGVGSVSIGYIDSGVLKDHPQLRGLVVEEKAFVGTDPKDRHGHGTTVALQGLRPHFEFADSQRPNLDGSKLRPPPIISARVTDDTHAPQLEAVIEAIRWMAGKKIRVVNISLGFTEDTGGVERLCDVIRNEASETFFSVAGANPAIGRVFPAACQANNVMSVGAATEDGPAESVNEVDVYAPSSVALVEPWRYWYEEAMSLMQKKDFEKAKAALAQSVKDKPNSLAYFQLGLIANQQQDLMKAAELIGKASALDPNQPDILGTLGSLRVNLGDYAGAIEVLDTAIKSRPNNVNFIWALYLAALNTKDQKRAENALHRLSEAAPNSPRLEHGKQMFLQVF